MKKMKASIVTGALLLSASYTFAADIHPKVQAALDWELPANTCGDKPIVPGGKSTNLVDENGVSRQYDVDHKTLERIARQAKRWHNCTSRYKNNLLADFETLKNSATHGITKEQADLILGKMSLIQAVYLTPGATPEELK